MNIKVYKLADIDVTVIWYAMLGSYTGVTSIQILNCTMTLTLKFYILFPMTSCVIDLVNMFKSTPYDQSLRYHDFFMILKLDLDIYGHISYMSYFIADGQLSKAANFLFILLTMHQSLAIT